MAEFTKSVLLFPTRMRRSHPAVLATVLLLACGGREDLGPGDGDPPPVVEPPRNCREESAMITTGVPMVYQQWRGLPDPAIESLAATTGTFGQSTAGSGAPGAFLPSANDITCTRYTLPIQGDVLTLTFDTKAANATVRVRGAIYTARAPSPSAIPYQLVATTDVRRGVVAGWNDLAFAVALPLVHSDYYLCIQADQSLLTDIAVPITGAQTSYFKGDDFDDDPYGTGFSWGSGANTSPTEKPIYATYTTPSAGGALLDNPVLGLGSSTVYGVACGSTPAGVSVRAHLGWPWNVSVNGNGGEFAADTRTRWTSMFRCAGFRAIYGHIGLNDILNGGTAAATWPIVKSIYDEALADGMRVIPITFQPACTDKPSCVLQLLTFNALLRDYATTKGLTLIDLWAQVNDGADAFKPEYYCDGTHVNGAGQDWIAERLYQALQ
jgi:hypothetical protein